MVKIPDLLSLESLGDSRFRVPMPAGSQEGLNVVFGGQLIAQMIMAVNANSDGSKYVKSINTIFSRAGVYDAPLELQVESFQAGRTWAGDVVSAWQNEKLLTRSLILSTADEADLITHNVDRPSGVSAPQDSEPTDGIAFPGAEVRLATPKDHTENGVPAMSFWTRMPAEVGSVAASQAILAWATNGWLIGLSMQGHGDTVQVEDAHHSLATGVIGHTVNFHADFDAGSWIQVSQEATWAGRGRIHGRGLAFTEDGTVVASFTQDSMLKAQGAQRAGRL
jgi:acyl-CoA thioesterase II